MSKSSLSGPLSSPVFRLLWLGGVISNLGTMVQTVGAGWLMATIASSNDMVAFVQAATTLPIMLFSIPSGAIADSYERRRVLLVAQVFMMAVAIGLAAVAVAGHVTPWLLLALTFLLGCGTALHTPAWQASVGDIGPRDQIAGAVTLNSMGLNMTRSVGPALGGFIVAAAGAAAAFAFNALSFVPMVFALLKMPAAQPKALLPRENLSRAVWAGLRYVSMSPDLMIVILRGFAFGVSAVAILALLPLVARDLLDGSALVFGVLLGAFGIGAILGGLANGWLGGRTPKQRSRGAACLHRHGLGRLSGGHQPVSLADQSCAAACGRKLGAGAVVVQRGGATFHPALGGWAGAVDLSDRDFRRDDSGRLDLGRAVARL